MTFIFVTAWVVGTLSRRRRAALAVAASRAERAEASLDEAAARAAAAERVRIARELHDVVSHHVSLMAVQAEAVGALLPARPEAAATSADLIGSTARTAMTELRRLLGVLRFQDHEDPERLRLTPVPSLSRLDELTDATRAAGLGVTHETSGPQVPLSPGVDLTAYRIIQEALTNTLRHAPGATAFVRVTYEPSHVSVEVTNTAPARTPSPVPAGAALARGSSVRPMTGGLGLRRHGRRAGRPSPRARPRLRPRGHRRARRLLRRCPVPRPGRRRRLRGQGPVAADVTGRPVV